MPVVGISIATLNTLLGVEKSSEELSDALGNLGCDVEDVTELSLHDCPQCTTPVEKLEQEDPPKRCPFCGYEAETPFAETGKDSVVRLDLLADRPDLFDAGGLARALKGYLGIVTGLPEYSVEPGEIVVEVAPELSRPESYRPFIRCAELEWAPLESSALRAIMKLQENLHWGIGRDRKLASIGVYDLDTVKPPIRYRAVKPEELQFHPLGMPGSSMTPYQVLTSHPKGQAYAHLLSKHEAYPLLVDSRDQVLSMPPIINSEETKVKRGSSRFFIDVTGVEADYVENALKTLVCSLVEMGARVRSVAIRDESGKEVSSPDLTPGKIDLDLAPTRSWLGLPLNQEELGGYLEKMRLGIETTSSGYHVGYPAYRSDIRHPVDVMEDVVIAYGYANIPEVKLPSMTVGRSRPEEELSRQAREVMLGLGYYEIMSLSQTTSSDHFDKLGLDTSKLEHAKISNPKLSELDVVRRHLRTGIFQTLEKNRRKPTPQRIFEVGNVVIPDEKAETGVREERRLAFASIGPEAGYAEARAVMDAFLREFDWEGKYEVTEDATLIPGRTARVEASDVVKGIIGEVHPNVLEAFNVAYPVAFGEITLLRVL